MGEEPESSALPKVVSVPGLVAVAVLGLAVTALARLFGPENVLREVVTEVVASFGSTILVLAVWRCCLGVRRAERLSRNRRNASTTSCKTRVNSTSRREGLSTRRS